MKLRKTIFSILGALVLPGIMFSCEDEVEIPQLEANFTANTQEIIAGDTISFSDKSLGRPSRWNWTFEGGMPATSVLSSPSVVYEIPGTYQVKLVVGRAGDSTSVTKEGFITVGYNQVTADFSADETTIIQGETITFTDLSEGTPTEWAWEFIPKDGGETITSGEQNPVITFEAPGVYTVNLTVSNPAGSDEKTKTDWITIIDASYVEADFKADTRKTYSGEMVQFTDASLGTAESWNWIFEGGTPSTSADQNPTVTYSTAGKFKVTLEVSNGFKTSAKERVGYITVAPGDGLLAFLTFNGDANDSGPLALAVTNDGNSVTFGGEDRDNLSNATAVFDGSGSLNIDPVPEKQFGTTSYSIGIWLKTDQPGRMMIWQEGGGGAGNPTAWFRINDNTSDRIYRHNANTGGLINVGVGDGASPLSDNVWHYVVCIRDVVNGLSQVYVDGELIKANNSIPINDITNDLGFRIGGQDSAPGVVSNLYTGQLDDLVIYNRVLSQEEITLLSGF